MQNSQERFLPRVKYGTELKEAENLQESLLQRVPGSQNRRNPQGRLNKATAHRKARTERSAWPLSRVSQALTLSRQVTVEDFEVVCKGLYRALCIREKYMQKSFQRFPKTPSKYLRNIDGEALVANESFYPGDLFSQQRKEYSFRLIY